MAIKVFAGAHRQVLVTDGDEILFRGTLRPDWHRLVHAYFAQQHNQRPNRFFDEVFEKREGEVPMVLNAPAFLDVPNELNPFPWELLFSPGTTVARRLNPVSRRPVMERVCAEQIRLVACQHEAIDGEFQVYAHFNSLRESMRGGFGAPVLSDVAHSRERFLEILREGASVLYITAHCDHREGIMFADGQGISPQWLREHLDASAITLPPVVILNCCGWPTPEFANVFLHRGASVVVAAFGPILIRGMAMFGEVLMRSLTEKRADGQRLPVGEAVFSVNSRCFGGGVFLSAFGDPLISLEPPKVDQPHHPSKGRRIVLVYQNRVVETIDLEQVSAEEQPSLSTPFGANLR